MQDTLGAVGVEEPVFLIRGCDVVAPEAIRAYAGLYLNNGGNASVCAKMRDYADAIEKWQTDNESLIGVLPKDPMQYRASVGDTALTGAEAAVSGMTVPGERIYPGGGGRELGGGLAGLEPADDDDDRSSDRPAGMGPLGGIMTSAAIPRDDDSHPVNDRHARQSMTRE